MSRLPWTRWLTRPAARPTGFYLDGARLVLAAAPAAYAPATVAPGDHWIAWLHAHRGGQGPLSERARRADLYLEFAARPPLGQPVDLARAVLQASYEAGGQALTYAARQATGTLVLQAQQGELLLGRIDVAFTTPALGAGPRRFAGAVRLEPLRNF